MFENQKIVILGGGTAGWMTAAAISKIMKSNNLEIVLIESDEIGTIGVGEASLPQIKQFNDFLGIEEKEFMVATNATFKLGIEFIDWGAIKTSYIHPFGDYGTSLGGAEFQHIWARGLKNGISKNIEEYSFAISLARELKFDFPSENKNSVKSEFSYAYHFDAGLYAKFLRNIAETNGVKRIEGKFKKAEKYPETGFIKNLIMENDYIIEGNIFIDCTGFRGLLINKEIGSEWEDWSNYLPCDRAIAVPCENGGDFTPYTRSIAREAGWQWRIPLQNRIGNGYVYSSKFISDEKAADCLLSNLDGKPIRDLNYIKFQAGRRQSSWNKNCIAIGLASGFLEPLESTSIYLIQIAIQNFLNLLPTKGYDETLIKEFNRLMDIEYERIRDFLILHYFANAGSKGELWDYTRNMQIPDSLQAKIDIFKSRSYIERYNDGLFSPASWLAVFTGQNIIPHNYDVLANNIELNEIKSFLDGQEQEIKDAIENLPSHKEFIEKYCAVSGEA